ncbi:MAG: HNH endonuclease signature motif containing protein [Saprospiraceae bacterium]
MKQNLPIAARRLKFKHALNCVGQGACSCPLSPVIAMSHIPESLRKLVAERANHRCEYCLVREGGFFFSFEVDHIVSLKHEGDTSLENLALACSSCNRYKGSNLGTYLDKQRRFVCTQIGVFILNPSCSCHVERSISQNFSYTTP